MRTIYGLLLFMACAVPASAATTISPAQETAILLPVQAWVHAFDTQQETFPSNAFTDDCIIIDEFAPFAWSASAGTTSVRQWYAAVEGLDSPQNRQEVLRSKETVDVGKVENLTVSGDLAYMTFHATWSAVGRKNKMFVQHGLFTVVERKTANGWRMSANSWGILP